MKFHFFSLIFYNYCLPLTDMKALTKLKVKQDRKIQIKKNILKKIQNVCILGKWI